jgi:hypothetical protein
VEKEIYLFLCDENTGKRKYAIIPIFYKEVFLTKLSPPKYKQGHLFSMLVFLSILGDHLIEVVRSIFYTRKIQSEVMEYGVGDF